MERQLAAAMAPVAANTDALEDAGLGGGLARHSSHVTFDATRKAAKIEGRSPVCRQRPSLSLLVLAWLTQRRFASKHFLNAHDCIKLVRDRGDKGMQNEGGLLENGLPWGLPQLHKRCGGLT